MLTYILLKTQSTLMSVMSREGQAQPDANLHPVQNPEDAFVRKNQEGPTRCWLTTCSKPRGCSCQQQAGGTRQRLTYTLFKSHSTLLSATSRKGQPDAHLHTFQNPKHAPVSNKQEGPECWLTPCSKATAHSGWQQARRSSQMLTYILFKPRACSCQQQAERASQMLTYILFKTHSMPLSAISWKGQPDADLHSVQNPEGALVSNKQEEPARLTYKLFKSQARACQQQVRRPARCWLTSCSKPRACSCQQQAGSTSQMLTYTLYKTQIMLFSAISRKDQSDADLHAVENPEHALVNNKQMGTAKFRLTACSKPRACSCQQQAGSASQIMTYTLFKTQSMLLSATSRKCQPDPDLHAVQNPEHALVSNKQEGPARSWLTLCAKHRACSCQQQAGRASQILTYILFKYIIPC